MMEMLRFVGLLICFFVFQTQIVFSQNIAETEKGIHANPEQTKLEDFRSKIFIDGNKSMVDSIYSTLVGPPIKGTEYVEQDAKKAADILLTFLRKSGYELANVHSRAVKGNLFILIDEGRLERIVLPQEAGLTAILVRTILNVEDKVYNRYELRQSFESLEKKFGIHIDRFELRRVINQGPPLIPFGKFPGTAGIELFPPLGQYELHIYLKNRDLAPGFNVGLRYNNANGLVTIPKYRFADIFAQDDRIETTLDVGLRFQDILGSPGERWFASQLGGTFSWYSPPILPNLKLFIRPNVLFVNQERIDLHILSYNYLDASSGIGIRWVPSMLAEFESRIGARSRNMLGIKQGSAPPSSILPTEKVQPFVEFKGEIQFGSPKYRIDMKNHIELNAYEWVGFDKDSFTQVELRYRKGFPFGYDTLRLGARAAGAIGRISMIDEIPMSHHLQGLFANEIYTQYVASASLEYQWAIERERFMLSVLNQVAIFQFLDRSTQTTEARMGDAIGLGVHSILFDTFQISAYYMVGAISKGLKDQGVQIGLVQLF